MIFEASMADDRCNACPLESQAFQHFDVRPRPSPKRTHREPARAINRSKIVNKSQDSDTRDCLPARGCRRVVLTHEPVFSTWMGYPDFWPTLANKSINSVLIR